jgi:hypothetical protein
LYNGAQARPRRRVNRPEGFGTLGGRSTQTEPVRVHSRLKRLKRLPRRVLPAGHQAQRAVPRGQSTGAPASYQRLISARSASVIWVALFSGMSLSTTTCW